MSDAFARLKRLARELRPLLADLKKALRGCRSVDWSVRVPCPKSAGNGADVELWYLAEHLLTTWHEFESLLIRYLQYFGQPPSRIPDAWRSLKSQCFEFDQRVTSDRDLEDLVSKSWDPSVFETDSPPTDPEILYHEIIASHWRMAVWGSRSSQVYKLSDHGHAWAVAKQIDEDLRRTLDVCAADTRRHVRWHLRQYRHAMLDLSWLSQSRWQEQWTAFEYALDGEQQTASWLTSILPKVASPDPSSIAFVVLERLYRAITEIGFDAVYEDVMSKEMLGGEKSPLAATSVEVLGKPNGPAAESPPAVVVSLVRERGAGATGRFAKTVEKIVQRLEESPVKPECGIVLSDSWNPHVFENGVLDRINRLAEKGVPVVVLLVGAPDTELAPAPLVLEYA